MNACSVVSPTANGALLVVLSLAGPPVSAGTGLSLERVADGIQRPVAVAWTWADPGHIYVAEHWSGLILRVDRHKGSKEPFFTVSGLSTGYSYGLCGLVFHPDYATNGKFYVSITTDGSPPTSRIREYVVDGSDVGNPRDLLVYVQPHGAHNNADIQFGPDGMLYIASGDGGDQLGGQLPGGNPSQRLDTIFGKILRIDVDDQDPGLAYRIPDGSKGETPNPFAGATDSFGNPAR